MRGKRTLAGVLAFAVALAAITGGIVVVERETEIDTSPVGESKALAGSTAVIAGATIVAASGVIGSYLTGSPDSDKLNKTDSLETKKAIYSKGATLESEDDVVLTQFDNFLDDSETIARIEGKNAYIEALNNGSSKAAAKTNAREAVADYYATRQKNLIAAWNITYQSIQNIDVTQTEDPNLSGMSAGYNSGSGFLQPYPVDSAGGSAYGATWKNLTVQQVQLVTGEQVPVLAGYWNADGGRHNYTITSGDYTMGQPNDGSITIRGYRINKPTDSYSTIQLLDHSEWKTRWNEIESKNTKIQNEIDKFVNDTYDGYVSGTIETADLVDPYLAARGYSPDSQFQTWALRSYASMGYTPPTGIDDLSYVNITDDGTPFSGILLNSGSDEIEEGVTYNTSRLNGTQYLISEDGQITRELDGDLTVTDINTQDGGNKSALNYTNPSYNATDTAQYQDLMDRLQNLTAKIEARQAALRNAGGGGLFNIGNPFGGIPGGAAGAAAGVGVFGIFLLLLSALVAIPPRGMQ